MTEQVRPWSPPQMIWSALLGVALWTAVGFSWFGTGFDWSTSGGAQQAARDAVLDTQVLICVAQARKAPDSADSLKALAELASWKRREYVETATWATMPGSESPESGVADLCATRLTET